MIIYGTIRLATTTIKKGLLKMCEHILIRKVSMTLIACYTGAVHRIVVDGLILRIMMHNRGLGNPVMGVLRLAPATVVRAA